MQCRFWTKCSFSCGTFGNHSPRPKRLNGWSWMRSWRKSPQVSEWAWLRGRRSWRRWILARDTGTLVPMATCMPLETVEEQCRHVLFIMKKRCDVKLRSSLGESVQWVRGQHRWPEPPPQLRQPRRPRDGRLRQVPVSVGTSARQPVKKWKGKSTQLLLHYNYYIWLSIVSINVCRTFLF